MTNCVANELVRPCGLCANRDYRLRYIKDDFRIGRCQCCGLVQVLDDIEEGELRDLYGQSYYEGENEFVYANYLGNADQKIRDFESRIDAICRDNCIQKPGACLEIGCAFGLFLEAARQRGWKTRGIELSEYSARYAREHLGLDVASDSNALQKIHSNTQDMVVMWDVIEHLKEPLAVLHEIRRVLVPWGLLVLSTGDIGSLGAKLYGKRWHLLRPPHHLFYFDRKSILKMLERAGFAVKEIHSDGHPFNNHGRPRLMEWIAARDKFVGWRLDAGPIMIVTAKADPRPMLEM